MPFYDYRCEDCGHEFEASRPVERRDDADCPRCGGRRTRRVVRAVGYLGGSRGAGRACGRSVSGFG
jgi:putative FmdB family regulatory protein